MALIPPGSKTHQQHIESANRWDVKGRITLGVLGTLTSMLNRCVTFAEIDSTNDTGLARQPCITFPMWKAAQHLMHLGWGTPCVCDPERQCTCFTGAMELPAVAALRGRRQWLVLDTG